MQSYFALINVFLNLNVLCIFATTATTTTVTTARTQLGIIMIRGKSLTSSSKHEGRKYLQRMFLFFSKS